MIPFAAAGCMLYARGEEPAEVRILELSEEGFTFRLSAASLLSENIEKIVLLFYDLTAGVYRELALRDFRLEQDRMEDDTDEPEQETERFYIRYRVTTDDEAYRQAAPQITGDYMRYIRYKMEGDEADLAERLTGYPAEEEKHYPESFLSQKCRWFADWKQDGPGHVSMDGWKQDGAEYVSMGGWKQYGAEHVSSDGWNMADMQGCELALSLDRPEYYERYLKMPLLQFTQYFWESNQLFGHPVTRKKVDCLYIGNQFCHLLFPEKAQLFPMLEKAGREHVKPVLVFTYVQESRLDTVRNLLEDIVQWCRDKGQDLEIVVNDWGMLSMLREEQFFCLKPTLGILLQKRRKDVRLSYKCGWDQNDRCMQESSIQADFYREYLCCHFRIQRFSYESCGYPVTIAPGGASLHFPFYQMNTSQFCTLYAQCRRGSRGRQSAVSVCPEYCRDTVFLYPEFLHMVGRYNSLFGYDAEILGDGKRIRDLIRQGVDRIVAEFL